MQVVHVDFIDDGVVAKFIRLAIHRSRFYSTACKPHGEAAGIVITPGAVLLCVGCAAKFTAPPHERIVEQSTRGEVGEQARDGLVHSAGVVCMLGQIAVLIPRWVVRVVAVVHLDKAHAGFCEATGHEALAPEVIRRGFVDSVERERRGGFAAEVHRVGRVRLHPPGEFVALDHGFEFTVAGFLAQLLGVQLAQ